MQSSGSELPAGYKRCEYLESSGHQYIDTKITPVRNDIIEFTFMTLEQNSSPFGCMNFTMVVNFSRGIYVTYSRFFMSQGIEHFAKMSINSIYKLKYTPNKIYLYENSNPIECTTDIGTITAVGTLWLFGRSDSNSCFKCRYYGCFIENAINLIPALDRNGRPCMYDTVTRRPFYNQGTGEFGYELLDGTYVAPI